MAAASYVLVKEGPAEPHKQRERRTHGPVLRTDLNHGVEVGRESLQLSGDVVSAMGSLLTQALCALLGSAHGIAGSELGTGLQALYGPSTAVALALACWFISWSRPSSSTFE